jgi:hypothetical protein
MGERTLDQYFTTRGILTTERAYYEGWQRGTGAVFEGLILASPASLIHRRFPSASVGRKRGSEVLRMGGCEREKQRASSSRALPVRCTPWSFTSATMRHGDKQAVQGREIEPYRSRNSSQPDVNASSASLGDAFPSLSPLQTCYVHHPPSLIDRWKPRSVCYMARIPPTPALTPSLSYDAPTTTYGAGSQSVAGPAASVGRCTTTISGVPCKETIVSAKTAKSSENTSTHQGSRQASQSRSQPM